MPFSLSAVVPPDVVVEVGVAAVDDRVARFEVLEELLDLGLGRVAGRDHHPDGARLLELVDQLLDRVGRDRALALRLDLLRLLRRPVVDDDLVTVADQPADHVGAHPTETDEPEAHVRQPSVGVASAASMARSRAARPASGSAPRWTLRIGRSCDGDGGDVAVGLGVDAAGRRCTASQGSGGRSGGRLSAGGTSRRRPALVQLPGRMEEARAVAGGRGVAGRVAEPRPDPGHRLVARRRRGDEGLESRGRRSGAAGRGARGARRQPRSIVVRAESRGDAARSSARRARRGQARRGSAAWPPRRWAGRTGRCPRTAPAIAVATSQRTNSPPRSIGSAIVDADDGVPGCLERVGEGVAAAVGADRRGRGGRRPGQPRRRRPRRSARGRPARSPRRACRCSRR